MKKKKITLFDSINILFMLVLMVVMIYPMYFTIIASFSEPNAVASGEVTWKPIGFTLESYKYVLEYSAIWKGYLNAIIYTVVGTAFSMFLTIPTAFAMSKSYLPYKKFFTAFYMISMYFGGGLVPMYLQVKNLGLLNTRAVLILIGCLSIYNMIVARSFFQSSIPETIYEAARIDGAGEIRCFLSIALPLAKPVIAVLVLYYAVARWNDYFNALLYIKDDALLPLQSVLRNVLLVNQGGIDAEMMALMDEEAISDLVRRQEIAYTMKYSLVFIASAPLLAVYPFIQKYFVKGVMVGAVKE